jgi:hypothetical protein
MTVPVFVVPVFLAASPGYPLSLFSPEGGLTMLPLRVQEEIMDLAVEDYTPLFDITSIVKGVAPSRSPDEHIELARAIVHDLARRGYVKLYYDCLAKSTETYRHAEELDQTEVNTEVENRDHWLYHERRPPDQRWVTIGATPAGEQALRGGEFSA